MIYDLSILQGILGTETSGCTVVPEDGGYASSGAVKRAHQFLCALMTGEGESLHDPAAGSQFAYQLFSGALRSADAVESAFVSARTKILQKMETEEPQGYPEEDRIESVAFVGASVAAGQGVLRFRVVTAGGSANVSIPTKNPGVLR